MLDDYNLLDRLKSKPLTIHYIIDVIFNLHGPIIYDPYFQYLLSLENIHKRIQL